MKIIRLSLTIFAFAICFGMPVARAGECSGNGCEYIQIQKRGGCIVIVNTHSRPIRVQPKTTFVGFGVVYANSEFIPKLGFDQKECASSYNYDYTAFITGNSSSESGACMKVRPLDDLGYGSGHKTRFCKSKGYAGVTNFPGSDYRDYGGGFCYTGDKKACLREMRGYPK
jgi:hypothetical protein